MEIFLSTLNQTAFLFGLIIIGYILMKLKVLPENGGRVLSGLENNVFIPALVLRTFIENFTIERIRSAWYILVVSIVMAFVFIFFAIIISKAVTKDKYIQNIYTYGLSFSNFGFMGNAVVSSLFPDIFFEYLIFTLPLWSLIYVWGVPRLLLSSNDKKQSFKENLKAFINPMFIAMLFGMIIGILNIKLPAFIVSIVDSSANCMSPVAMLLTGITVAFISFKETFLNVRIYIVSIVRLIIFPVMFIIAAKFIPFSQTAFICGLCSLAMPLGLNTIVIPAALGKDTSVAAGMAVISHLLSCITIPVIFMLI